MSDTIHVGVRIRPLLSKERNEDAVVHWKVQGKNIISQIYAGPGERFQAKFDRVFEMNETNQDIFKEMCSSIVNSVMQGINGTIFAYGQTGTGKTYTMMGCPSSCGVIIQAINAIFDSINNTPEREFLLRISYMEIYNEAISDLLTKEKNLRIHENLEGQVYVGQLKEELVTTPKQIINFLHKGEKNRHVGETNMNEHSSRSHTIFRMVVESRFRNDEDEAVMVSVLNLVDLAGSERVYQTGAIGERFKEGCFINKSLYTLSYVIRQLSEGDRSHVNYRDSKLTRILQNSLGGNSKTAIICTVSPTVVEQTISTLKFASQAKKICNQPIVNEVLTDAAMLKRYVQQIHTLTKELEETRKKTGVETLEKMERKLQERDELMTQQEQKIRALRKQLVVSRTSLINPALPTFLPKEKRRLTWAGPRGIMSGPTVTEPILPCSDRLETVLEESYASSSTSRASTCLPDQNTQDVEIQTEETCLAPLDVACVPASPFPSREEEVKKWRREYEELHLYTSFEKRLCPQVYNIAHVGVQTEEGDRHLGHLLALIGVEDQEGGSAASLEEWILAQIQASRLHSSEVEGLRTALKAKEEEVSGLLAHLEEKNRVIESLRAVAEESESREQEISENVVLLAEQYRQLEKQVEALPSTLNYVESLEAEKGDLEAKLLQLNLRFSQVENELNSVLNTQHQQQDLLAKMMEAQLEECRSLKLQHHLVEAESIDLIGKKQEFLSSQQKDLHLRQDSMCHKFRLTEANLELALRALAQHRNLPEELQSSRKLLASCQDSMVLSLKQSLEKAHSALLAQQDRLDQLCADIGQTKEVGFKAEKEQLEDRLDKLNRKYVELEKDFEDALLYQQNQRELVTKMAEARDLLLHLVSEKFAALETDLETTSLLQHSQEKLIGQKANLELKLEELSRVIGSAQLNIEPALRAQQHHLELLADISGLRKTGQNKFVTLLQENKALNQQIASLRGDLASEKNKLEEAEASHRLLETSHYDLLAQQERVESENRELLSKLANLEASFRQLQEKYCEQTTEQAWLTQEQQEAFIIQNEELKGNLEEMTGEMNLLKEEKNHLMTLQQSLLTEKQAVEAKLQEAEQLIADFHRELEENQSKLAKLGGVESTLTTRENLIQELQDALSQMESQLCNKQMLYEHALADRNDFEVKFQEMAVQLATLEEERIAFSQKASQEEAHTAKLRRDLEVSQDKISSLENSLGNVKETLAQREVLLNQLQAQLSQGKEDLTNGDTYLGTDEEEILPTQQPASTSIPLVEENTSTSAEEQFLEAQLNQEEFVQRPPQTEIECQTTEEETPLLVAQEELVDDKLREVTSQLILLEEERDMLVASQNIWVGEKQLLDEQLQNAFQEIADLQEKLQESTSSEASIKALLALKGEALQELQTMLSNRVFENDPKEEARAGSQSEELESKYQEALARMASLEEEKNVLSESQQILQQEKEMFESQYQEALQHIAKLQEHQNTASLEQSLVVAQQPAALDSEETLPDSREKLPEEIEEAPTSQNDVSHSSQAPSDDTDSAEKPSQLQADLDASHDDLRALVSSKEEELLTLQDALAQREKEISDYETKLELYEEVLSEKEKLEIRFQEISVRLASLEGELCGSRDELNSELQETLKRTEQLRVDLEDSSKTSASLGSDLDEAGILLAQKEELLEEVSQKIVKLEAELEESQSKVASLEDAREVMEDLLRQKEVLVQELQTELSQKEQEAASRKENQLSYEAAVGELKGQLQAALCKLTSVEKEHQVVCDQLQTFLDGKQSLESCLQDSRLQITQLQLELNDSKKTAAALEHSLKGMKEIVAQKEELAQSLQEDLHKKETCLVNEEIAEKASQISFLQEERSLLQKEKRILEAQLQESQQETSSLQTRLEDSQGQIARLEESFQEVEHTLKNREVLLEVLQEEYSRVEAEVKGREDQARTLEASIAEKEELKTKLMKTTEELNSLKDSYTELDVFYQTLQEENNLVRSQLEDAKSKIAELLKDLDESRSAIAILEGSVNQVNALFIEKEEAICSLQGKLSKKEVELAERDEERESYEELERKYQEAHSNLTAMAKEKDSLSASKDILEGQRQTWESKLQDVTLEISNLRTQLEEHQDKVSSLEDSLAQANACLSEEKLRASLEIQASQSEVQHLNESVAALKEELAQKKKQLDEKIEEVESLASDLSESDDQLIEANSQIKQLSSKIAMLETELQTAAQQFQDKDKLISKLNFELAEKDITLSSLSLKNDELSSMNSSSTKALVQEKASLAEKLSQLEKSLQEQKESSLRLKTELEEKENQIQQLAASLANQTAQLDTIKEKETEIEQCHNALEKKEREIEECRQKIEAQQCDLTHHKKMLTMKEVQNRTNHQMLKEMELKLKAMVNFQNTNDTSQSNEDLNQSLANSIEEGVAKSREIEVLEERNYHLHQELSGVSQELQENRSKAKKMEALLASLQAGTARLQEALKERTSELDCLRGAHQELELRMQEEGQARLKEMANLEERTAGLHQRLSRELQEQQVEAKKLAVRNGELQQRIGSLEAELKMKEEEVSKSSGAQYKNREEDLVEIYEGKLKAMQARLGKSEAELSDLKRNCKVKQELINKLEANLKNIQIQDQHTAEELRKNVKELEAKLAKKSQDIKYFYEDNSQKAAKIEKLEKRLEIISSSSSPADTSTFLLKKEQELVSQQLADKCEQISQLQNEIAQAKTLLIDACEKNTKYQNFFEELAAKGDNGTFDPKEVSMGMQGLFEPTANPAITLLEEEIERLKDKVEECEEFIDFYKRAKVDTLASYTNMRKKKLALDDVVAKLENQLKDAQTTYQNETACLKKNLDEKNSQLEELRNKAEKLQSDRSKLKEAFVEACRRNEQYIDIFKQVKDKGSLTLEVKDLEQLKKSSPNHALRLLQNELTTLKSTIKVYEQEIDRLTKSWKASESSLAAMSKKNEELEEKVSALNEKLQSKLNTSRLDSTNYETQITKMEKFNQELAKNEREVLQQMKQLNEKLEATSNALELERAKKQCLEVELEQLQNKQILQEPSSSQDEIESLKSLLNQEQLTQVELERKLTEAEEKATRYQKENLALTEKIHKLKEDLRRMGTTSDVTFNFKRMPLSGEQPRVTTTQPKEKQGATSGEGKENALLVPGAGSSPSSDNPLRKLKDEKEECKVQ